MLKNLTIRNFRLFKELIIKKLGRVNLFVGKNNSGKSCLLEAMQIYATGANAKVLYDIVSSRDENIAIAPIPGNRIAFEKMDSPFRYLFHGYRLPVSNEGAISIGSQQTNFIQIKPNAYQDSSGPGRSVLVTDKIKKDGLKNYYLTLDLREGPDNWEYISPLFPDADSFTGENRLGEGRRNVQVVSTRELDSETVATHWDIVNLTDLEDEVVRCLHLIDPNIKRIALVGETRANGLYRIPIVRYADSQERVPLRNLGEGMIRLFHIILSMVTAKDGFLLIDEFENGLHWSIYPGLWEMIFKTAERLNVQVFATTHNKDCIRGFHHVWSQRENDGTFQRLDRSEPDKTQAVQYTCESLSDALETDVEVR